MSTSQESGGRSVARNTVLNFAGQAIPLLIGVVCIPLIIKGLGKDRFGILSLIWVVIGYFSLFDLGLGKATTKFVSGLLVERDDKKLSGVVWTATLFNSLLGLAGGVVLAAVTPLLVGRVFNIPVSLLDEARSTFYLLAIAVPIVVITSSLRGVLEGLQRFDLVNIVRAPSSSLMFLIPALAVPLGLRLPGIVVLLLVARSGAALAYLLLCFKVLPDLRRSLFIHPKMIGALLSFGGWVTVSNVVSPVVVYLDRLMIGSLMTMEAVAYYTAPYEIVTRLWIVPLSLVMSLFPVFSQFGKGKKAEAGRLYAHSLRYLLLLMGPILLFLGVFARDILRLWLGAEFASQSTAALQILCFAVFINSLAHVPFTLIQGIGRPDLTAKFHLIEIPVFAGAAWFLIPKFGIAGAAMSWTLRVLLDAVLLFWAVARLLPDTNAALAGSGLKRTVKALAGLALALIPVLLCLSPLWLRIAVCTGLTAVFYTAVWRYLLDADEKAAGLSVLSPLRRPLR
jgi:O-antigen/teichoic acid export membrane protein